MLQSERFVLENVPLFDQFSLSNELEELTTKMQFASQMQAVMHLQAHQHTQARYGLKA